MGESERRVAVVGDDERAETLREAVRATGAGVVGSPPADATFAVGEAASRTVLSNAPPEPVIPVGGHRLAFELDEIASRIERVLASLRSDASSADSPSDGVVRVTHPVLGVDAGAGSVRRAIADVALVTTEPARISEFAVGFRRGCEESFRADGVVVATPFGSDGYANAAGGPVIEPGGGLAVVPVAPFSTRVDARIAVDRVRLSVERETEPVSLVVDGTVREAVDPRRPVEIETVDRVEAIVPGATGARRAQRSETL